MKILLPTVYPLVAGSTRVLLAAQHALMPDHEVVVRAPFLGASEQPPFSFPINSLDKMVEKLRALPLLLHAIWVEKRELAGRNFDIIYVHDDLSLYVYGIVARFIGARVVRHLHMHAGSAWEALRAPLAHDTIHISEHAKTPAVGPLIRNPLRGLDVRRRPVKGKLVMAGSICANKNQLLAVETLGILQQSGFDGQLSLYGEIIQPDYARLVTTRAIDLGLADRVSFEGFAKPEDYLSIAHTVLVPSIYENQPLGLLEAIAAGVPVVASDIAAHRELSILGCIAEQNLQPLEAEQFAIAVRDNGVVAAENTLRVRELFAERRFSAELREFFAELERQMSATAGT